MRSCVYLHGDDDASITDEMNVLLGESNDHVQVMRLDMAELDQVRIASQSQSLFGAMQYRVAIRNVQSANPSQGKKLLQLIEEKRAALSFVLCAPNVKYSKELHKKLLRHPDVEVKQFRPKTGSFFKQWLNTEISKRQLRLSSDAVLWICQQLDGMQSSCLQLLAHLELYQGDDSTDIDINTVAALCGEERSEEVRSYCQAVLKHSPHALVLLYQLLSKQGLAAIQISAWLQNTLHSMLMYKQLLQKMSAQQAARQAKIFSTEDKVVFAQQHKNWSSSQLHIALYELTKLECLLKGSSVESDKILMQRLTLKILDV